MTDLLASRFQPAPEVRFQVVSGEAVLLDLDSEDIFRLNEIGTRVWELLIEHEVPETVLQTMLTEFEVDQEVLRTDMKQLLAELLEADLLTMKERDAKRNTP